MTIIRDAAHCASGYAPFTLAYWQHTKSEPQAVRLNAAWLRALRLKAGEPAIWPAS